MAELHFVGFNGYQQFPTTRNDQPKIIPHWTSAVINGTLSACSHRFVVLETDECFNIFGIISSRVKIFHELHKPVRTESFECCDEFIIASEKTNVWKFSYRNMNWMKSVLSFVCEEEKSVWEEPGNRILKFSFQQNHTDIILLLSNGSVWLLSTKDILKLLHSYDVDRAIDISSGLEHTLILTESGCVLTFGNGSRGQLGLGDLNPALQPVQITGLGGLKTTKIAAGGWHSCAITDSGDLYTWGWNNCGQLSAFENGKEIGLAAVPVLVDVGEESEKKVLDVACGRRHTIALLENGDLYSTGWNKYRQLGIGASCEKINKFTKCLIQNCQNVKVTCGPWYTILVG